MENKNLIDEENNEIISIGNNFETLKILFDEFIKLKEKSNNDWKFKFDFTTINSLFQKYEVTLIKINFQINEKEINRILNELIELKNRFEKIENEQKESNQLTYSELDLLIYDSWKEYISIAPFLYGKLSEKEVDSKRKLIQDSIEFYKNKNI